MQNVEQRRDNTENFPVQTFEKSVKHDQLETIRVAKNAF